MNTNTRKSFFLVEGRKATAVAQNTEFYGINNLLVYARTAFEARVISEAYCDELVGVDNVMADNGEVVAAVSSPSDDVLNEWIANYGKTILAADLLELVAAKGCVEVVQGVFLHTKEDLLPLNKGFADAKDAEFWIASISLNYMRPLYDGAEDSLLIELIAADGEEKIAKALEAHRTDGIVLCEVYHDTMTFTVVEEAQPQPKKIEPTITCRHEPPWAIVKTQDIEIVVEKTQKLAFSVEIEAAIKCAKQDGATIADIENIVILIGACAEKTAKPTQLSGIEHESAAKVAEDCKLHRAELLEQLRAIKTFADYIGLPSDKRYHIDALLSFNFARNEQSLSRMFDFSSQQEKDEDKIFRIEEICKWFRLLKIGPAINSPKYDQTFVDAGRC